ncbi:MAG: hypothetical protein ACLFVJ_20715 [Persicimonas sp.]
MTVVNFDSERRRKRSDKAHTAISYQLEYIYNNQKLEHFVLGDSSGLVLAGAGEEEASTVLAAYAPVLATHHGERRKKVLDKVASMVPGFSVDGLSIRSFEIDGETLYLCSVGRGTAARQASLYRAITGIRRILKQTAVAA